MGVVYKARDLHLGRFIALKILPSEKISDSERERRFVREAKAASALNHPNIVTIYDTNSASDCYFIAMEYIEGQSLDRLIPRKGMRLSDVLRYGVQIADALACAHRAGIVHRDLKPANVMVTDRGLLKVVDFGLAKLTERNADYTGASGETVTDKSDSVTEEGYIVGTLAYMSPEQAEDKPLDGRSDVFSMGCVLYEMVTGKRAFHGETKLRTLSAILTHEPPRISDLAENVPPELERVVSRCLRKDVERRFQGMADLKIALEELKEESESGRLVSVRQRKPEQYSRPVVLITALAVLILGIVSALWLLLRHPKATPPRELSHPTAVTSYRGTEENATLSPDGRQVAFSGNVESPDNYDIYVKFIGSDPPLRLTHDPDWDQRPVWSPDGRWIAFVRSGKSSKLILISPLGGGERVIAEAERLTAVSWTSDSKNVLATVGDGWAGTANLVTIAIDNGERKQLLHQVASAWLSHDGRQLALARGPLGAAKLYVAPVSAELHLGEPRPLQWAEGQQFGGCAWTRGDHELVCSVRKASANLPNLWRIDTEKPSAPELIPFTEGAWDPVIPASGDRLVFDISKVSWDVWRAIRPEHARAARAPARFAASTKADLVPQYSPDGSRIAFLSSRSGQLQVWVGTADGSNLRPLTSLSSVNPEMPRWSPDGKSLVFVRDHEIYTIDGSGGVPQHISAAARMNALTPSYSHDGKSILFASDRSGRSEIWRISATGGQAAQVTKDGGTMPLESPDGKLLVYLKLVGSIYEVRAMPVDGGAERVLLTSALGDLIGPPQLAFAAGGLFYIRYENPDLPTAIDYLDFKTGLTRRVITTDAPQRMGHGSGFSVSPDGRSFLYPVIDFEDDVMQLENFR